MLWTIAVVLCILWLLGMVSSYTLGGLLHFTVDRTCSYCSEGDARTPSSVASIEDVWVFR